MTENISVSIPLSDDTLNFVYNLLDEIEKKFLISFIKNKKTRPHINLISGKTDNLNKIIDLLKENLNLKKPQETRLLGYGSFLSENPTIYIRFEIIEYLTFLRKIFFENDFLWSDIDSSVKNNMWFPKSSIIHKDMKLNLMSDVIKFLNLQSLPKSMMIKEIIITNFTGIEKEVESFKLNF